MADLKRIPKVGDLVRSTLDEDATMGLVVEILDPAHYWSRGLGKYPSHVFRVLKTDGELMIWDVFEYPDEEPDIEVVT